MSGDVTLQDARGGGRGVETRRADTLARSMSWLIGVLLAWGGLAHAATIDRIVAIVNDEIITESDLLAYTNALREEQPPPEAPDPTSADMQEAVLQHLIQQRLILQEAKRAGMPVEADDVDQRLDALRHRFNSDEEFEQSLTESHLTKEQLKEKLHDQLMVQRLIDTKIRSTIFVSPQEVASVAAAHPELAKGGDRVRASHILVRVGEERSEAQARVRIEEIRRRLDAGEMFDVLARQFSEDPHASEGGAMGWVAQGELMPELDTALFSLASGTCSQPIRTRLGFHLVRVEERRSAEALSATQANGAIYQQLYQQKFQEALTRWLTQLQRHAYIQIVAPARDVAAGS